MHAPGSRLPSARSPEQAAPSRREWIDGCERRGAPSAGAPRGYPTAECTCSPSPPTAPSVRLLVRRPRPRPRPTFVLGTHHTLHGQQQGSCPPPPGSCSSHSGARAASPVGHRDVPSRSGRSSAQGGLRQERTGWCRARETRQVRVVQGTPAARPVASAARSRVEHGHCLARCTPALATRPEKPVIVGAVREACRRPIRRPASRACSHPLEAEAVHPPPPPPNPPRFLSLSEPRTRTGVLGPSMKASPMTKDAAAGLLLLLDWQLCGASAMGIAIGENARRARACPSV
ncbi:hypothetical protein C8Q76DRAFT_26923 [Earliella scabrosa]|nr:hypothetical protein C8Q76DRAFT_26923 [Earliella scabrosa]